MRGVDLEDSAMEHPDRERWRFEEWEARRRDAATVTGTDDASTSISSSPESNEREELLMGWRVREAMPDPEASVRDVESTSCWSACT